MQRSCSAPPEHGQVQSRGREGLPLEAEAGEPKDGPTPCQPAQADEQCDAPNFYKIKWLIHLVMLISVFQALFGHGHRGVFSGVTMKSLLRAKRIQDIVSLTCQDRLIW